MDTVNCTLVCYPHVQTEAVGQSVPMSEFMSFPPERLEVKRTRGRGAGGGLPKSRSRRAGPEGPRSQGATWLAFAEIQGALYVLMGFTLPLILHDSRGKRRGRSGSARRRRPLVVPHLDQSPAHLDRSPGSIWTDLRRIWRDLLRIGIRLRVTRTSPPRDIELWRSDSGDRPPHVHSTTHNI